MLIIKIIGGLGNQMFQYAYAKTLYEKGYDVKIDISGFETYKLHGGYQLHKYNIDLPVSNLEENRYLYKDDYLYKVLKKIGIYSPNIMLENSLFFNKRFLDINKETYIIGYFQSEKYFEKTRTILLNEFTLNQQLSQYTITVKNLILNSGNNCSIHIRRGDFTNNINQNIHGTCDIKYYQNAISYIRDKIGDVNYFIFSDDIDWVKNNLNVENAMYIESKEKRIPHEDIYLMSLCSHNIIANSSFSWWGAWLNKNDKKIVVAPKRWFADNDLQAQSDDIYCKSWMKL